MSIPVITAGHLNEHAADLLKFNKFDALQCASQLEEVFGPEIHAQIDGFINFALENKDKINKDEILMTLAHDLRGAFQNDKLMLPRVSGYADYAKAPDEIHKKFEEDRKEAERKRAERVPELGTKVIDLFKKVSDDIIAALDFEPWDANEDDIVAALDHQYSTTELGDYLGEWGYSIIIDNLDKLKNWMVYHRKKQLEYGEED